MKKLIQISLVVLVVFMLLLATVAASDLSAGQSGSNTAQSISATANTSAQGAQVAVYFGVRIVSRAIPERVGWNS